MINFEELEALAPYCAFCDRSPADVELLDKDAPDYAEQKAELESLVLVADMLGNHWCQQHRHLHKVMMWGARHGYPELHCEPYVILSGAEYWQIQIAGSKDENIGYLAEGYIDILESEKAS